MDGHAIFSAFHPHDEVEIVDVDHTRSTLRFRSTKTGSTETLPYPGLTIVSSTLHQGRMLAVQYGTVTADAARYSKNRRSSRGARKISAMAHLAPTITPLALAVMRWSLGDEACAWHLAQYAGNASTAQRDTVYHHDAGRRQVALDLVGGCVKAIADLGGARTDAQGLHLDATLPDVVASGAKGYDVSNLVGHPAASGTILEITIKPSGGTYIRLRSEPVDVLEAIATIPRLARAA